MAVGLDCARVTGAIPPACRRGVDPPHIAVEDGDALLVSPDWTPRRPARHLVPSLAVLSGERGSVRFELSVRVGGEWTGWAATATLGAPDLADAPDRAGPLFVDIDAGLVSGAADAVRVRARLRPPVLAQAPWLFTLSASDLEPGAPGAAAAVSRRLEVPALSQMREDPVLRHRICSPTSVAMVLAYLGQAVEPATLGADVYHPGLDLYGIWPAAVLVAARRGVPGYLLRFPDWSAAAWCLEAGFPVVASVRFEACELPGAALARTEGHLIVITGQEGDEVLVNDPAAPSPAEVPRRVRLADLERVWLGRAGVGYVFLRTTTASAG